MANKVAVVTGGNKGVGLGIVRALCKAFRGDVILTARKPELGHAAVKQLEREGLSPKFHQLDITDHTSVERLRHSLNQQYHRLDVLVNNAGIAYKESSPVPFSEQADVTCRTNFFGTLDVCETLLPLLQPHARVSNISSISSQWALANCSESLRERFTSSDITMDELRHVMERFVKCAQINTHTQEGFPESAYGMSKLGVTVMTFIHQRESDSRGAEDIVFNACCPGHVNTEMSSFEGELTVDQGAETPSYLALLPDHVKEPRGQFVMEKEMAAWEM